jgi:hypothetical protein
VKAQSRGASNAERFHGGTLDREGVEGTALVRDACGAAPEKPESTPSVQPAGVAGAMPDLIADAELRLLVSGTVQIASEDVRSADDDLARTRPGAMRLERHHREHRGETGGAEDHGLARRHAGRKRDQPVGSHARLLRVASPLLFADAPAGDDHPVARLESRRAGRSDRAGEIDSGDERELSADDLSLAGNRESVLVIEARVLDVDRRITRRESGLVELAHVRDEFSVCLVDDESFEHREFLRMAREL